jgi:two-component system, OmpR family, sensor histidine kinase BaeS
MSLPLRTRLFLSFLAILLLGMGGAALLAWRLVENLYIESQRENLLAQARLTAAALQGQSLPSGTTEPYLQTTNALPGIHTRLLSEQGAVLVSLPLTSGDIALPAAENATLISPTQLLERPEIRDAFQGQPATAIRRVSSDINHPSDITHPSDINHSSAGNRRVLYAAAPVIGMDGAVSGLVYLAMPLPRAGLPANWLAELGGGALVAAFLAIMASTWIARRIARPMEAIAHSAEAVSRGDMAQQVPLDTRLHELNSLGTAFNRMTESLRQSDQAKNAFVADVTHELRTPLTVIKGTLETLEDGAIDDLNGRGSLLASMQRETDRLIRLVNDLLVLTRADAGTLNLHLQTLNLEELARARCEYLTPLAARRSVKLCVKVDPDSPQSNILGDTDRLSQVLDNLLDNAIRYSPESGVVTVEVRRNGREYECAVHDCGPGISQKHLPMIFERFFRADASRNRQTGGAGLGLAIAWALVTAQGGRISVESVEGEGATLRFAVPASADCSSSG